jgi:hypothetical protein
MDLLGPPDQRQPCSSPQNGCCFLVAYSARKYRMAGRVWPTRRAGERMSEMVLPKG